MTRITLIADDGKVIELTPQVMKLGDNDKLLIQLKDYNPPEVMDTVVALVAKWAEIDESRVLVVDAGAEISVLQQDAN